jgi:hypothetical protein
MRSKSAWLTIGLLVIPSVIVLAGFFCVAKFSDDAKMSSDAAVRSLGETQKDFAELFYIRDAYDEESRTRIMRETFTFFAQTGIPSELGFPVIETYTREFKPLVDKRALTQQQYDEGLDYILSYAVLHGRSRTPDLIRLLAGWRIIIPEEQAILCRQITAASRYSGLKPDEMIGILTEGLPTIKAMRWSPVEAIEAIATMAVDEPDQRSKVRMPTIGLRALIHPFQKNN